MANIHYVRTSPRKRTHWELSTLRFHWESISGIHCLGAVYIWCQPPRGEEISQFLIFLTTGGGVVRQFLTFSDKGVRGEGLYILWSFQFSVNKHEEVSSTLLFINRLQIFSNSFVFKFFFFFHFISFNQMK